MAFGRRSLDWKRRHVSVETTYFEYPAQHVPSRRSFHGEQETFTEMAQHLFWAATMEARLTQYARACFGPFGARVGERDVIGSRGQFK